MKTIDIGDLDLTRALNRLSRKQLTAILEGYGFAVYDDEATADLRDAVAENVADGTIPACELSREEW